MTTVAARTAACPAPAATPISHSRQSRPAARCSLRFPGAKSGAEHSLSAQLAAPLRQQSCAQARAAASRGAVTVVAMADSAKKVPILINGAPGKMGRAVAQAAISAGVPIVPFGLTGPGLPKERLTYNDDASLYVDVFPADERDAVLAEARKEHPDLIVVDYTLPAAVNSNAEWYIKNRVPFVMGTTGGDRAKLAADVEASKLWAVIAPQMGKQVVAFLAALESLAEQCPGAYAGYKLTVVESHQSTKVDTSGTAKEAVRCFQKLGVDYDVSKIEMVRDPSEQMARMGVPENYLNGHAFHTYHLDSPDNTVSFEFQHNVCGRSIYADGAIDAVLFLAQKIKEGDTSKTLFNMIDVLKAGNMR
ncbi:hypothetical protein CLOM_g16092 [Closterium sp. NIES-68]|nr:hypothetical protein CLOM_g16092 [Closterium sp. NIES-68]GJP80407.1 hypothetical protein CLOP_g10613 [Closterium sp. NIES-67]